MRSAREIAERYDVSISYVIKARQRRDREGRLPAGGQRGGRRPKLADYYAAIATHVREHPGATLQERRAWLEATHGVSVSIGTMWNTLRRIEITRKKKTFEASERARADIACSRILWDWLRRKLDLRKLVFLDETWLKTNMSRLYGWARRGVRAVFRVPFEH